MFKKEKALILGWLIKKQQKIHSRLEAQAASSYEQYLSGPWNYVYAALGLFSIVLMGITGYPVVTYIWENYIFPTPVEDTALVSVPKRTQNWTHSRDFRKAHGVIHVGTSMLGEQLDPTQFIYYMQIIMVNGVYRTLTELDGVGNVTTGLALRWSFKNGGKILTLHLDPGAHFQDGTRITADDVAWTFSRFFWPSREGSHKTLFGNDIIEGSDRVKEGDIIPGIKALDPITIQFIFKRPFPTFLYKLAAPTLGILPKNRFEGSAPLASGPIQPYYNPIEKSWSFLNVNEEKSTITQLPKINQKDWFFRELGEEKNLVEDKLEPPAYLSKLRHVRVIPLPRTTHELREKIVQGDFDLIFNVSNQDFKELKLPPEYIFTTFPSTGIAHFFYNMKRPFFSEKAFRKDLSAAIQTIADMYEKPLGNYKRLHKYMVPQLMPFGYYSDKMPSLKMEEFHKKWKNKIPKKIKIILQEENAIENGFIHSVNEAFQDIGVSLQWEFFKTSDFVVQLKKRDYDILFGRYAGIISEIDALLEPLNLEEKIHFTNANTSAFFKKITELRALSNWKERMFAYQEAIEELEAEHYFIPLFEYQLPVIVHRDLEIGNMKRYDYNYRNINFWKMAWKEENTNPS